jgi:hypothetical protein
MRILIACERFGVVRDAFLARGHDAWSLDMVPCATGSNRHITGDVRDHLNDGWDLLMVAHPPCTRLCNSGVRWLSVPPKGRSLAQMWADLADGAALFSACWTAPIPRIAVENPAMHHLPRREQTKLLERERRLRRSGEWGPWESTDCLPGTVGTNGWLAFITRHHRNRVFAVLERVAEMGVVHLGVSSLSGDRPTWHEMQRIKNDLAGPDATAIEVYPPQHQVVDDADMFHIWVLRGKLPFGLHVRDKPLAKALRDA